MWLWGWFIGVTALLIHVLMVTARSRPPAVSDMEESPDRTASRISCRSRRAASPLRAHLAPRFVPTARSGELGADLATVSPARPGRRATPHGTVHASIALARLVGVLVALILVAGCGGAGDAAGGATGDATDDSGEQTGAIGPTSETFAPPSPEPTEPTTPTPTTPSGDPAISLPRLPIGGNASTDEDDARRQCVGIDWIVTTEAAPEIPPGYAVAVTGAVFDAAGFEVDPDGCGPDTGSGRPSCVGHVMRTDSDACDLGVRALPDADPQAAVEVGLSGLLSCSPNAGAEACERFAQAVDAEPGVAIELNPAPEPTSTATETPTAESPATQSPTSEESTPSSSEPAHESGTQTSSKESGTAEVAKDTTARTAP